MRHPRGTTPPRVTSLRHIRPNFTILSTPYTSRALHLRLQRPEARMQCDEDARRTPISQIFSCPCNSLHPCLLVSVLPAPSTSAPPPALSPPPTLAASAHRVPRATEHIRVPRGSFRIAERDPADWADSHRLSDFVHYFVNLSFCFPRTLSHFCRTHAQGMNSRPFVFPQETNLVLLLYFLFLSLQIHYLSAPHSNDLKRVV